MNSLRNRLSGLRRSENGFSLIDVVVTVAIIVALSVGGFVSYSGIVDHAKQAAVDYAASNVYKAAVVYENDSDSSTTACSAVDEYNESTDGISVVLMVPNGEDFDSEDFGTYQGYWGKNPTTGAPIVPEGATLYTGC